MKISCTGERLSSSKGNLFGNFSTIPENQNSSYIYVSRVQLTSRFEIITYILDIIDHNS